MLDSRRMLELIPGLPDLILFWMKDVSVIRVSRCGITRGTFSGKHVLTLIWMIMIAGSFKIVSNLAIPTISTYSNLSVIIDGDRRAFRQQIASSSHPPSSATAAIVQARVASSDLLAWPRWHRRPRPVGRVTRARASRDRTRRSARNAGSRRND